MDLSTSIREISSQAAVASGAADTTHTDLANIRTLAKGTPPSFLDPTVRLARDKSDAAEYVDKLLNDTRIALTGVAMLHGPVFNLEAVSNDTLYAGIKRFEAEMDTFRKLILGKSALVRA